MCVIPYITYAKFKTKSKSHIRSIEEADMINSREQVLELDCDLDTLICWLQDNPDWAEKISQAHTKRNPLSKIFLRIQRLLYPPRLSVSSLSSFDAKALVNFLQPIAFSIVEAENALEIKPGEATNNVKEIGYVKRSNRIKSAVRSIKFRMSMLKKIRTKQFSERYLNAFIVYINSVGLPPARRLRMK